MRRLRANASATGSPDDTISSLPGPSTRINSAGELARAALIRAATASSGVLKRCCARAPFAMVRNAVATARIGNHRNKGKEWGRGDEGNSTMTSSITSASAVETLKLTIHGFTRAGKSGR